MFWRLDDDKKRNKKNLKKRKKILVYNMTWHFFEGKGKLYVSMLINDGFFGNFRKQCNNFRTVHRKHLWLKTLHKVHMCTHTHTCFFYADQNMLSSFSVTINRKKKRIDQRFVMFLMLFMLLFIMLSFRGDIILLLFFHLIMKFNNQT